MAKELKIVRWKGKDIVPYIADLAKLRIRIFKDYPYLYEGNLEYESRYLQTYVNCPESVVVLVLDNNNVVGASTAIPLEFETVEYQQPFMDNKHDIRDIFYFGESVLLPEYRGRHIYKRFFQEREAAAREIGSNIAAFAAIERPANDSRRPKDYVSLDNVWKHFGYEKHPELCMQLKWKEIGEMTESDKPLVFWLKKL